MTHSKRNIREVSAYEHDEIRNAKRTVLTDGTNVVKVNPDGSINTSFPLPIDVTSTDLDIRNLTFATDKVDVTGSTISAELQTNDIVTGLPTTLTAKENVLRVNQTFVHKQTINELFINRSGTITTLSVDANQGDTYITVTSSVGFSIGDEIKIESPPFAEIGIPRITNVSGNVLTLDRPLGFQYLASQTTVEKVSSSMNVLGTLSSPVIFEITPMTGFVWQLTRFIVSIVDNLEMDDGLFGGIPELTNGVSFRATTESGRTIVFTNWKNNADIKLDTDGVKYTNKAKFGQFGLDGIFNFTDLHVVVELNGNDPLQKIEVLIQDDLTQLTDFKIKAQGRIDRP
jgi:hypothetical protein